MIIGSYKCCSAYKNPYKTRDKPSVRAYGPRDGTDRENIKGTCSEGPPDGAEAGGGADEAPEDPPSTFPSPWKVDRWFFILAAARFAAFFFLLSQSMAHAQGWTVWAKVDGGGPNVTVDREYCACGVIFGLRVDGVVCTCPRVRLVQRIKQLFWNESCD